jgi:hypothetical protein
LSAIFERQFTLPQQLAQVAKALKAAEGDPVDL